MDNLENAKKLSEAIIFAAEKHNNQFRKGDGMPYIFHPLSVMSILMDVKKDSKNIFMLCAAAILHDTVEDCDITCQDIADRFGYKVASIVDELTSDKEKIKDIGKKEYLLLKCQSISSYSLDIKLADLLHNLTTMNNMDESFINKRLEITNHIIDNIQEKTKITKTHMKLISKIKNELKKYNK